MEKIEIVITKDHVIRDASFMHIQNCPLAVAARAAGIPADRVGVWSVQSKSGEIIGYVEPGFEYTDYSNLISGAIKTFKTTFTPVKQQ